MICQEYVFIPQKKSNQNRKLLGINKTIQTLREFYPTTNTLLSMSREVSAIRYHAQGCCKATCKAPSCVPGELPAATASKHFKASDHCKHCSHRKYTPASYPATAGSTTEQSSPDTDPCLAVTSA